MALEDLVTMIRSRVPFLTASEEDTLVIVSKKLETFYFLQSALNKNDEQVEDDDAYTPLEKMLVADVTAYDMIKLQVNKNSIGTGSQGGKTIKKIKADVVEAEYMFPATGTGSFLGAKELLSNLKDSICQKATMLKVYVPLCDCAEADVLVPFIFVE